MATTTPDNIWTPDSDDPALIVPDMASTANTVQQALTRRANYYTGTSSQMASLLSSAPVGALFYNTTESKEYRKVGSSWVLNPFGNSTGNTLCNNRTNVTGTLYVNNVAGTIHLHGGVTGGTITYPTGASTRFAALPSGSSWLPASITPLNVFISNTSNISAYLATDGNMYFRNDSGSTRTAFYVSGSWPAPGV